MDPIAFAPFPVRVVRAADESHYFDPRKSPNKTQYAEHAATIADSGVTAILYQCSGGDAETPAREVIAANIRARK